MIKNKKRNSIQKQKYPLDEYMMRLLNGSSSYGDKLFEKSLATINFFIVFFTAIVAAVAGIYTASSTTITQKFVALILGSLILGFFGSLVYIWELSFYTVRKIEGLFRIICHQYFKEKAPSTFERFGLSSLLTVLRRQKQPKYLPIFFQSGMITIIVISIFSSTMFGISNWCIYKFFEENEQNLPVLLNFSITQQSIFISVIVACIQLGIGLLKHIKTINAYQKEVDLILSRIGEK
jgi:hypothetical protein